MKLLCLINHKWTKWIPDIDEKYSARFCTRCGKRE